MPDKSARIIYVNMSAGAIFLINLSYLTFDVSRCLNVRRTAKVVTLLCALFIHIIPAMPT